MRRLTIVPAALAIIFASPPQSISGGFVILGGADTVVTQRFTREGRVLRGELKQMNLQELTSIAYAVEFAPDSGAHRVEVTETTASGVWTSEALLSQSQATSRVAASGRPERRLTHGTNQRAHPSAGIIIPLIESIIRHTKPAVGEERRVLSYNIRQLDTVSATITRPTLDSVLIVSRNLTMRLAVSNTFDIMGGVMIYPVRTWTIVRVP